MSLKTWIKLITIMTTLLTSLAMVIHAFKDDKTEQVIAPMSTLESLGESEELVKKEVSEVIIKPKEKVHKFKIKIDFEYQYDVKAVATDGILVKSIAINIQDEEQLDTDRKSFNQINLLWDLYCSNTEDDLKCKE